MRCRALAIQIGRRHARIRILRPVAERTGQCRRAALVVVRILPIIDRTVDRDRPHRCRIAVAVAVVLLAAVARRPHIDVAQPVAALVHAVHDRPHRCVARPVHRLAVVRRSPRRTVDVDLVRLVAHRVRLNQIGHVRLVEHPDAGDLRVVRHADAADVVVAGGGHLARTAGAMAVEPVVGVARIRVRVVAAEVVAGLGVLVDGVVVGEWLKRKFVPSWAFIKCPPPPLHVRGGFDFTTGIH